MGIAIVLGIVLGVLTLAGIFGAIALFMWNAEGSHGGKVAGGVVTSIVTVGLLIAFVFVPFGYYQVDASEIAVVRTVGKITDVKTSGLYHKSILTQKITIYDIKTQQLDITTEVYTKDAQPMTAQITMQFSIKIDKVKEIATNFGELNILKERIERIAVEKSKVVLASDTAMGLIENRATLSPSILSEIKSLETQYFITFENVVLTDMAFSDAFEQAVEQKMVEQQKVEQAKAEAERLLIEQEAQKKVAEIQAAIKVALAQADADALQVMITAWADPLLTAEVKEMMLRQLAIEKWDGKMPETVVGSDFFEMLFGAING